MFVSLQKRCSTHTHTPSHTRTHTHKSIRTHEVRARAQTHTRPPHTHRRGGDERERETTQPRAGPRRIQGPQVISLLWSPITHYQGAQYNPRVALGLTTFHFPHIHSKSNTTSSLMTQAPVVGLTGDCVQSGRL